MFFHDSVLDLVTTLFFGGNQEAEKIKLFALNPWSQIHF
jgi:hypothetical protein